MSKASNAPRWPIAWVVGASSGMGRAVALELARRGVTVAVSARSVEPLAELARTNPSIHAFPLDVSNNAAVARTLEAIETKLGAVDLAVFAAGIFRSMGVERFSAERASSVMAINYMGAVNLLEHLMPVMIKRRAGKIGLVASVSGFAGLPYAAAYGPTKAALNSLAESLYPELERANVKLSLINPGYVETPMTHGSDLWMPFIISADDAATRIVNGLEKDQFEIAFPTRAALMLRGLQIMPASLFFWITRRMLK